MTMLTKAISVKPLEGFRLAIEFSDGSRGDYDLDPILTKSSPILAEVRNADYFRSVFIQRGAPTWPNGFDLAPWALHDELRKANALSYPSHAA